MAPVPIDDSGARAVQETVTFDKLFVGACDIAADASDEALVEFFEIARTADFIKEKEAQRVCLQFPDELLFCAARVTHLLEALLPEAQISVLGDTSHGACCADEVAAEHADAQVLIHYGNACLSPTRRLPTLYVFGRKKVPETTTCDSLSALIGDTFAESSERVMVLHDLALSYVASGVSDSLRKRLGENRVVHAQVADTTSADTLCGFTCEYTSDSDSDMYGDISLNIVWIGHRQHPNLVHLTLNLPNAKWHMCDPWQMQVTRPKLRTQRSLMQRFFVAEKVKDASTIGIVVGTLSVANYLDIVQHLRDLIRSAGKKAYVISVGKLNVPKLANFSHIDIFCLVACPLASIVDTTDYFSEIATPIDVELALVPHREWTGEYSTDFRQVLQEGRLRTREPSEKSHELSNQEDLDAGVRFNALTNSIVPAVTTTAMSSGSDSQALVAMQEKQLQAAHEHFSTLTYRGLEPRVGETPVATIERGLHGTSQGYSLVEALDDEAMAAAAAAALADSSDEEEA